MKDPQPPFGVNEDMRRLMEGMCDLVDKSGLDTGHVLAALVGMILVTTTAGNISDADLEKFISAQLRLVRERQEAWTQ